MTRNHHTHPRPLPRLVLLVLALFVLAPLLAACGTTMQQSSAPVANEREPTAGEATRPQHAEDALDTAEEEPPEELAAEEAEEGPADHARDKPADDTITSGGDTGSAEAPAAAPPLDGDAADGAGAAIADEAPGFAAGDAPDAESPREPDEVRRPERRGQPAPLKAGEIDDNQDFAAYLDYLASYQGPPATTIDVSERYRIAVRDGSQRPLVDARVRIYDGEQQVFEGRTYASGETLFLPAVADVSDNASALQVLVEQGNSSTETTLQRGEQERLEVVLDAPDLQPPDTRNLDILFLLDTTGSMEDELTRIQDTIDSIAQRIDEFEPRPNLRFALVAYRDRGDDYVTRPYDFTSEVGAFRDVLNTLHAEGGGDTPEAVNEGLHDAVQEVQWADDAVRLIFLVADAPPHLDYEQDYDYIAETRQAVAQGIKIYPIAASNTDLQAEYIFRQMAQQTLARFIFLTYQPGESSGVPGESRDDLQAGQEEQYTVENLDNLIVETVRRELAEATGAQ
jgi:hypothetical protein